MGQHDVMVRTLGTAFCVALLSGCASMMGFGESEFTCAKNHSGMPCDSVEQIYRKTNGPNWRASDQSQKAANGASHEAIATGVRPTAAVPVSAPSWPTPVLEPAQVLRVWIAPWVDESQSLHWPSYVFAEVTPRKWSFGNADFRAVRQLTPLQVAPQDEPIGESESVPVAASGRSAGAAK